MRNCHVERYGSFLFPKIYKNRPFLFVSMIQKGVVKMIEVVNDKERNLKNLKQIGTPREDEKIYIENLAYSKIKEDVYREKRVFVLMGHTERMQGRYATFVEAIVPVTEIEFSGSTPRWNNTAWSKVFREIKRMYEDMIIVGWALDIKGMSPRLTPELERVHREHFGGVHQLLFLLDTLEQEETFYVYKENKLVSKDGFYIYHKARSKELRRSEPKVDVAVEVPEMEIRRGGMYRQYIQEQKQPQKDSGNIGIAIAVAMLILVIGVGLYENSGDIFEKPNSIEVSGEQENEIETEVFEENIEIEVIPGSE